MNEFLRVIVCTFVLSGFSYANELVQAVNEYPVFIEVVPEKLSILAHRKHESYVVSDFEMKFIESHFTADLIRKRGLQDMRCVSSRMKKCILLYGVRDGAVIFLLNEDYSIINKSVRFNQNGRQIGLVSK